VADYVDIVRLKQGSGPPANVKLLVIKLRDDVESVSTRRYASPQLKFKRDKIRELEELNLVYKNSKSELVSHLLILSKSLLD
jgi:hypothetical protein